MSWLLTPFLTGHLCEPVNAVAARHFRIISLVGQDTLTASSRPATSKINNMRTAAIEDRLEEYSRRLFWRKGNLIATEGDYLVGRRLNVPIICKRPGIHALAGRTSYVKTPALSNTKYTARHPPCSARHAGKKEQLREEPLVFATPSLQIKIASSLLSGKLGTWKW